MSNIPERHLQDVAEFFQRWTAYANVGDWDAFAALLHPDVVLHDPMTAAPARGRADVVERARQQYAPFREGHTAVVGQPFVSLDGSRVAYRWRFTGMHAHPIVPPGFAATGRAVVVEGVSELRLDDGVVTEARLFFDTTDVARQVLAAPAAGSNVERVIAAGQRLRAWRHRRRA